MQRTPLLLLCVAAAATAMSTTSTSTTTTTTTQSPREHRAAEAHTQEIASKIVTKIKTLAEHHQLPKWMQQQLYPEDNLAVSSYPGQNIHVIREPVEPSLDTSIYSATGYHMKGMLGFVEYLILLILLKGSIDHVAARFKASLKTKEEPLVRNDRDLRQIDPALLTELSHKVIPHLN